ncbi:hypothetical protein QOZ80_5AG0393430 [Eleusine coracana subsp. coracana]|nr:hypothetical protein QOZ80_5AG0393430 [Eleusine coracana subsp. coracana]
MEVGAEEPRERRQGEEEKAGRQPRGGGMKFRVSARAPHGVGALLLIGGAVLAGAAVVAWRHARRGKRDDQQQPQPSKKEEEEVLDSGGVVEDGGKAAASAQESDHRPDDDKVVEGGESAPEIDDEVAGDASAPEIDHRPDDEVEGAASAPEVDRPDDDGLRGEEEDTEIGSNGLDNGGVTEEIQEVQHEAEIVADEVGSERAEKFDPDSTKSTTEISMPDDAVTDFRTVNSEQDSEQVEKFDQNSTPKLPEISTHDVDTVIMEKGDENSTEKDSENDHNSTKSDTDNDQYPITNHNKDENSSENNIKEDTAQDDNEDVEASDECSHNISHPDIVLDEQSRDGAQEAESMENSPTAQLMMHPEQLLDDMAMDTEGETAEAKPGKGTVSVKDVLQQEQQKATAEPDGLAGSPALSSLVKPTEKKEPEVPGRIETGMKIEQDYANGGLKEHRLITKGGAMPGGAVMTMDRRSSSIAILALMFALTIGITIVVRLYAPPRATKLQMDLQ